jgi:hypothetical protein
MAERFELFRLSLLPKPSRDMFSGPDLSREEYLRKVFAEEVIYTYAGEQYHYVPMLESAGNGVIAGRLGKKTVIEENRPPSEGLTETKRDTWKASLLVIDPTEHQDGQKAAVEIDRSVASPGTILFSLTRQINRNHPEALYSIEAASIIQAETFWAFAEQNRGQVTAVKFDFFAPNMFGGSDSIIEELRDFREKEKAHRVSVSLHNRDGLNLETEKTREAVDYINKSGGKIRAKAKMGQKYSSTDKAKSGVMPDEADSVSESTFDRISRFAKQILGRE